jgi:hypothetical protein
MEHCIYSYDAHCNRFHWLDCSSKEPTMHVWNLSLLDKHVGSSMAKPDPTLVIRFPAVSAGTQQPLSGLGLLAAAAQTPTKDDSAIKESVLTGSSPYGAVTVLTGIVHAAFSQDTLVSVTVTETGDVCLHGATPIASNTTSTVQATPVMLMDLKQAIVQAVDSLEEESVEHVDLRVHSVTMQPLGSSGSELIVATNWGMVVLELSVCSNPVAQSTGVVTGCRHVHFGAGLGSLGKSVITVQQSSVMYGSLDVLTANPSGLLDPKNPVKVYESPMAQHMPPEFYKKPFRLAPVLLASPTGVYVCAFWPCEFRYEVLHVPSLLQQVGQLRAANTSTQRRNPVVASGIGICDYAWVSDDDVFAVLHAQEEAAAHIPKRSDESGSYNLMSPNLKMIGASALGAVNLATSVTKTATNATLSATKLATSAAMNTTMTVTKGATNAANMTVGATTKAIRSGAKGVTKGVKKSFGIFGGKKKKGSETDNTVTADDDDEEDNVAANVAALSLQAPSAAEMDALKAQLAFTETQQRYVEFRGLEPIEGQSAELSGGIPAATCNSLGELALRGGKRNPPTNIFGGPVICVASRSDEDQEGHAYFYTRKSNDSGAHIPSTYISSGPTLPYPDLVTWDDDGFLCAIVVGNRVAVYLSDAPDFVLLGSVRIAAPSNSGSKVTSVKFVHRALFCCTWNSIHCVLLGDLNGGICHMDTYLLASAEVPTLPDARTPNEENILFFPAPLLVPLVQPSVLGYQSGSLMVSTLRGVQAIPLTSSLMRIGLFLASGQVDRASKWFDAVRDSDHEALAAFLERRGYPELAVQLPGLSVETIVDFSMRYDYVDRLEDVVETFGVAGLRAIDMGRGVTRTIFGPEQDTASILVSVGAFLLAHGMVELTRRMATECLRFGDEGKRDAFLLGTLLLSVDEADGSRLIQRAVEEDGGPAEDWLMGNYVHKYLLSGERN